MDVRITTTHADPARLDDGIAYVRDEVLPKTNLMKGSLGSVMGVDRASGRGSLMSCWTDRESLDASHQAVVGMRAAAARRLDGSDTAVETFEAPLMRLINPVEPGSRTRTTRIEVPADGIDRAVQLFDDRLVRALERYDGLCAVMVMINREVGVVQTSVVWEQPEALAASRGCARELLDVIIAAVPGSEIVDAYELEVVLAEIRPPM